ncbi:integrase [Sphingomonas sp. Root710]|uniref:tyrosine-type recombinase/integrase n=1 Tax=Sphingomonas sp. Root710 TaxID=1736594 RepID=UPI0006F66388|nr:site-specific integrase [Sphingomonas sp. Root710]KRB81093.1 integrase [Sphingomonas sp. Root710]
MLTDAALRACKPRAKPYKVTDRDGMYAHVAPSGTITFRLDYRLHGRRETLHLGRYGPAALSLALAREKCIDARRVLNEGRSPAQEKQREKRRLREARSFGEFGESWLAKAPMADSTRSMRRAIFERDLLPHWNKRLLREVQPNDLRALCGKIVDRGAPATAIHVRDIVKQIYGFAILHGEKVANPAEEVGPASIATFVARDRSLTPSEIRVMLRSLEKVATLPTIRLGMRLFLLTLVRKSELQDATWDEIDFENAVWSIPKERMKRSKAHNVYLSRQALDIMVALKTCAGNSRYLLPSRYDADAPMSRATFNRVTYAVVEQARLDRLPLDPFTVHDLRRTGSTLLNESGFNRDWIEKCLAHEDGKSSRGVYNKAEYEPQRRHMLQEWADMIDAWVEGQKRIPTIMPPNSAFNVLDPSL